MLLKPKALCHSPPSGNGVGTEEEGGSDAFMELRGKSVAVGQWPVVGRRPPRMDEDMRGALAGTTFCQSSSHCDQQFGGSIANVSLPLSGMSPLHIRGQCLSWCRHHGNNRLCPAQPSPGLGTTQMTAPGPAL